jgi:hypothetical protein
LACFAFCCWGQVRGRYEQFDGYVLVSWLCLVCDVKFKAGFCVLGGHVEKDVSVFVWLQSDFSELL